jgi:hypothetical protein
LSGEIALTDEIAIVGDLDDQRIVIAVHSLSLTYQRVRHSWTHSLSLVDGREERSVVLALESDPDRDHPTRVVSPVFQEAHRHDPEAAVGLLLTGNWFQHHFSAAVSLSVDPVAEQGAVFDVDVADRCRSPVEVLAATYILPPDSGALESAGPERIVWQVQGSSPGRLELIASTGTSLAMAEAGRAATQVQILAAIEPGGFTHRLRYQWRWATR